MDTETFLLVRRDLQDRIEKHRQQIASEKREHDQATTYPLLGPLARWALSQATPRAPAALRNGLLNGAVGWLASTIAPRLWGSFHKRSFLGRILERL